jgi:hypothetical protein
MSTTDNQTDIQKKRDASDKMREFHVLKAREHELETKLYQLDLDKISLTKALESIRASLPGAVNNR